MASTLCQFKPVHSCSSNYEPRANQRYRHPFNDFRLASRAASIIERISHHPTIHIESCFSERKDQVAAYRFLSNSRVELSELIEYACTIKESDIEGRRLLCLLDNSSLNLGLSHSLDRKDWASRHGCLVNGDTPGFKFMAALVLDEQSYDCLGPAEMLIYDTPKDSRTKEVRRGERLQRYKLPIEQRESGSWVLTAQNCKKRLASAESVTFVMDREADKYEILARLQHDAHFVVRAKFNRSIRLANSVKSEKMLAVLEAHNWMDTKVVKVNSLNHFSRTKGRRKRKGRQAKLRIRYIGCHIEPPNNYFKYHKDLPLLKGNVTLVEVKEDPNSIPSGEVPIEWRIWTNWPVRGIKEAWEVIGAYRARWNVEEFFRVLKQKGVDIESSQLKDPERIKKLFVMTLKAATNAIKLVKARDGNDFIHISQLFDDEAQELLHKFNRKLSGKTESIVNPHKSDSLAYAAWIIGRLGGWNGYKSQRPPGPIRMKKGMMKFYELLEWKNILEEM